jgi:transcriptional regulator with XRE-family HTH domain
MTDARTDEKQRFGIYLSNLMKSKRIGQLELAEYLQVSVGMVSRFATGRNLPSDLKMEAIVDFFGGRISHDEEVKLMQHYLAATSPMFASIEQKSRNVVENHFLHLFSQHTEKQQNHLLARMLQTVEENNCTMAHNTGLEEEPGEYNATRKHPKKQ